MAARMAEYLVVSWVGSMAAYWAGSKAAYLADSRAGPTVEWRAVSSAVSLAVRRVAS